MIIEKAQSQSLAKTIKSASAALKKGGVIMHATETCYGFACDALDKKAILRLYKLKKMDLKKPSSIMVAGLKQAQKYGKFSGLAAVLAKKYWPGPLTLVVPRRNFMSRHGTGLPQFLNPGTETIGIRNPAHNLTLALLRAYKRPLITTSANISGGKEAYSMQQYKKTHTQAKFENKIRTSTKNGQTQLLFPDLIIDSGAIPRRKPSTIVAIEKNKIKILRQGKIKI